MSFFPDASLGNTGAAPPPVATFVGGTDGTDLRGIAVDPSGKQRVLLYDAAGNALTSTAGALNVNIGGGLANPLPTTDAADGSTAAAVPTKAIQVAGSDGTNLRALATDTTGRQKVLLYDSAGTAIVLVSGRVPVDGSGVTQPISAASLPLPAGASTAAKQPALGTAGAASTDVITVQGITSMTPLKVDSSAVTQPENLVQLAGTAIDVNSGNKSAGTQRIVIATDQPQLTNALKVDGSAVTQPISAAALPLPAGAATAAKQPAIGTAGTSSADVITVQGRASMTPLADNITQLAGTAVDVNSGNKSAGTLRVVLATDQPALTTQMPTNPSQTNSGDVLKPWYVGNKAASLNLAAAGSSNFFTAAAYYYVTSFSFNIDLASTNSLGGSLSVTLVDSVNGIIGIIIPRIPIAAAAVTYPSFITASNPPGFFYHSTSSASTLAFTITGSGTLNLLVSCTITYGFTTVPG